MDEIKKYFPDYEKFLVIDDFINNMEVEPKPKPKPKPKIFKYKIQEPKRKKTRDPNYFCKYYQNNKDKILKQAKIKYDTDEEYRKREQARRKEYYQKNKTRILQYNKYYYYKNRDALLITFKNRYNNKKNSLSP